MYKTLTMKVRFTDEQKIYWQEQCRHVSSLWNCAIYLVRQHHYDKLDNQESKPLIYWKGDDCKKGRKIKQIRGISYPTLDKFLKKNKHYSGIPAQAAQQILKLVEQSIKSYNGLVNAFFAGGVDLPSMPKYKKKGGLAAITFPTNQLSFDGNRVKLPVCRSASSSMICDTWFDVPEVVPSEKINQIRVRPSRGEWWIDWILDDGKEEITNNPNLDYNHALSIDHGVKFWLLAVTTKGKSLIVEAPQLKTAIWKYQALVKDYKSGKSDFYWDEYLEQLTAKYNLQVRDAVNKAARFVINRCLKNGLGNLVIGWNEGHKQNINLGCKNNYEVVNMPTARLIKRLRELCPEYGIKLFVTSEKYTSIASFVDNDDLPDYGEKPEKWKPTGKRISRDIYRPKNGQLIHADINAACNILRKVADHIVFNPSESQNCLRNN